MAARLDGATRRPPREDSRRAGAIRAPRSLQGRWRPDRIVKVSQLRGPEGEAAVQGLRAVTVAPLSGRASYEDTGLAIILSRHAALTNSVYNYQWRWWALFCRRRGTCPLLPAVERDAANREWRERMFLDYVLHCSVNVSRAVGTIRTRLLAVKARHAALGEPDPFTNVRRCWLALRGFGTAAAGAASAASGHSCDLARHSTPFGPRGPRR